MSRRLSVLSLSFLVACSGGKADDSATDDTSAPEADAINMEATLYDGLTGAFLVGAELCVEEPVVEGESCYTTDEYGFLAMTWENPETTNFTLALTLENYIDTLYLGRYDDDVAAQWAPAIAATGVVTLSYSAFSASSVAMFLSTGGVTQEAGNGMMLVNLLDSSGFGVQNAAVTVTDETGATVGTVHYANPLTSAIDTTLEASSASGAVVVANAAEGTHTLTVTAPGLVCEPGFSWRSAELNTVEALVRADTMTRMSMVCG